MNDPASLLVRQIQDTVLRARARMEYGVESVDDLELHLSPGATHLLLSYPDPYGWIPVRPEDPIFWRGLRIVRRRDLDPGAWHVCVALRPEPPRAVPEPEYVPTGCDCGDCDG